MKRSKSDYRIQTVTNALRLLEEFGADEELGVTELSRRLGLHKNNVFRLLATLEEMGYVEQAEQSERYRLGVRCLELGYAFSRHRDLVRSARPVLEGLARETGETVHLGVLRDFQVVHLDGEPASHLVATTLRVGQRLEAHCTALGKALLAASEASVRERFDRERVARGALEPFTSATITDREKLFEHLRTVASQGWAVDLEERATGLCCAAAPVHDATGTVVAALSVSGPLFRLDAERLLDRAVPAVLAAAARLSRELGWAGA